MATKKQAALKGGLSGVGGNDSKDSELGGGGGNDSKNSDLGGGGKLKAQAAAKREKQ